MPPTPLPEKTRVKLLSHYIGDVRAWKADDVAETVIFGVKDPAKDTDDQSFYAMARDGALTYLGTTALGKDGGCQPIVYNDGTVALLLSEVPDPTPGAPGSTADLYLVTLQYRLTGEPAGTDQSACVDQPARTQALAATRMATAAQTAANTALKQTQSLAKALAEAAGQFD